MTKTESTSASIQTATLLGRLRGTPGLWLFVLLAGLGVSALWCQWLVVHAEATSQDIGFDIQRSSEAVPRVAINDGRWPGIVQGDLVKSVNGFSFDTHNFWQIRTALPEGPLRVVFEHEGKEVELRSHTTRPAFRLIVAYSVRLLTGALLLLIGIGAFLMRPGGAVSWLFFLMLYSVGLVTMITAGFLDNGELVYLIIYGLLTFAPVFGLCLYTVFPRALEVKRWHYALILTPAVTLMTLHVAILLLPRSTNSLWLELATRFWAAGVCVALFVGQTYQQRKARRAKDARMASMYWLLMLSTAFGLFAPVLMSTITRAFRLDGSFAMEVSASFVITYALLMGVVLVRHNPLSVDRYATSVVGYVLTVGSLGVVFAGGMLGLPLMAEHLGLTRSSEALVGVTAGVTLSVGPVYRWLRRRVDRWFSEEQANVMQTATVLRSASDAVQKESQVDALRIIVESLTVLGVQSAALWQLDSSGRGLRRAHVLGVPVNAAELTRSTDTNALLERSGGVKGLTPTEALPVAQQVLWNLGLVFSVPVRAHGVAVGFLGIARRPSGFAYRSEDEAFVSALAAQAGLALERGDHVTNIGRYRVERRLAAGGMAEIFVAWQLGPGGFERKVALKRLLPELAEDPKHAASLLDEASIAARLSHPSIAQVYEVGLEGGQHFIAMEFVDGPPLRALLAVCRRRAEPMPLPVFVALAQALLGALHHAHTATDGQGRPLGVVHRDVTPANVLLTPTGDVKLVDFGLVFANARLFRTQTGIARGTLPYMSPEQAAGAAAVDARTDVYSVAATLYEALTLVRAFPEGPYGPRPVPASAARESLPTELDAVFTRATDLNPDDRFSSAEGLSKALTAAAKVERAATAAELGAWVHGLQPDLAKAEPKRAVSPTDVTKTLSV